MSDPKTLDHLRNEIRTIDDEILTLMSKRLKLAGEVGRVKFENGFAIKNFKVEKEVIERAKNRARELGLYEKLAEEVAKLQIRFAVLAQEEHHTRQVVDNIDARKITIVGGCGSMGLWLTRFFKSFGHHVVVVDSKKTNGLPEGVTYIEDLASAVRTAEFVILATPILVTAKLLEELSAINPPGIVLDICSLKSPLLKPIAKAEQAGIQVTSIHPMFGPKTDLLSGQNIVFCDTTNADLSLQAMNLFHDTTANLVRIPIAKHDELMGYVLGMSHMMNLAFAKAINDGQFSYKELEAVASSTFRAQLDVAIPIINENQDLYFEIQAENSHTKEIFQEMIRALQLYLEAVSTNDRVTFKDYMESSRIFFTP